MDVRVLENRVNQIVNRVVDGRSVEDDLVECKARWPEGAAKIARRIAGSANAARGADVLWIIGLDEDSHRVVDAEPTEHATWWDQVERCFADAVVPDKQIVNVTTEHGTVTAIAFSTERAPYLVTTDGKGGFDRDVPWRSGTKTRTAKRHELLSILVEQATVPTIEAIDLEIRSRIDNTLNGTGQPKLSIYGKLFFSAPSSVMLPAHRWTLSCVSDEWNRNPVAFEPEFRRNSSAGVAHQQGIDVRNSGLIVNGSDTVVFYANQIGSLLPEQQSSIKFQAFFTLKLTMPIDGDTRPVVGQWRLRHRLANLDAGRDSDEWSLCQN